MDSHSTDGSDLSHRWVTRPDQPAEQGAFELSWKSLQMPPVEGRAGTALKMGEEEIEIISEYGNNE